MATSSKKSINFTKEKIEKLEIPSGREEYHDTEVRGLVLRVSPTSRVWYYIGRVNKHLIRKKLGKFPDMPVLMARGEARKIVVKSAAGEYDEFVGAKNSMTLGKLCEWYSFNTNHVPGDDRPRVLKHKRSHERDSQKFKAHLSHLYKRRLSDITQADIEEILHKGVKDGVKFSAAKAVRILRTMWRAAVRKLDIRAKDPTAMVEIPADNERTRFLSSEELSRWFDAVNGLRSKTHADCIMVCLLTGARKSNVQSMEWQEIDLEERLWIIPANKTKKGVEMVVVLTDEVVKILSRRLESRKPDCPWVFPAVSWKSSTGHVMSLNSPMNIACRKAGITGMRVHDLRRTLGSWQAIAGSSELIIGRSLGHRSSRATRVYARLILAPVRESVERATEKIMNSRKPLPQQNKEQIQDEEQKNSEK